MSFVRTVRILVACVLICLFSWSLLQYYVPYQLGDSVGGNLKAMRSIALLCYPRESIAYRYMRLTTAVNHVDTLNSLVPIFQQLPEFVVHARIGDVIDHHTRPVDTFWSGDYHKPRELRTSRLGRTSEGYVMNVQYYQRIIAEYLREHMPGEVTIVGGCHLASLGKKSQAYIVKLSQLFRRHGFSVEERITTLPSVHAADADFGFMCNAKVFVPSGGGFSSLVAEIVRLRGNVVLVSSESGTTEND